jgi:hypothetical protein
MPPISRADRVLRAGAAPPDGVPPAAVLGVRIEDIHARPNWRALGQVANHGPSTFGPRSLPNRRKMEILSE